MNRTWTYRYEEAGGYDSITGAYFIQADGQTIAVIDQADFGQAHCVYERLPEAEEFAMFIVEACNQKEVENAKTPAKPPSQV